MTVKDFIGAWPALNRQVKGFRVPWLDVQPKITRNPFMVLVSCILSLRTQDRTTGEASERLFRLASNPEELAGLPVKTIEKAIYPVGFYRVKARQIRRMSKELVLRHDSKVPDSLEDLLEIKGVGRKTANLVLTLGHDKYGICVDTHVHRIVNRWGLVKTGHPHDTEFALRNLLPRRYWKKINGVLVAFGQNICKPVSPLCSSCSISQACSREGVSRSR